jgi:hypothetical protein
MADEWTLVTFRSPCVDQYDSAYFSRLPEGKESPFANDDSQECSLTTHREECNLPSADSVAVLIMPHALDTVVGAWLLRVSRSGRCSTTYGRESIGRAWMLDTCGALMHALWQWLWWISSCGATTSESWTRSRWSCQHKSLIFCLKTHPSGGDWYMSEYTSI